MELLLSEILLDSLSWATEAVLGAHANYDTIHASLRSFNELYFNPVQISQRLKSNAFYLRITCENQTVLQVIVMKVFLSCC